MLARNDWHKPAGEKRTVVYNWPRQQAAGDAVTLSGLRVARRSRRQHHRPPASAHTPRQHHDRARWQPADATDRRHPHAAPAHRADAVVPRRPARRVRRSRAAPGRGAADSVHPPRGVPAGVQSGSHAASHRRATHDQARQSRSAHRAMVLWQAHPHARHLAAQGFATASGMATW